MQSKTNCHPAMKLMKPLTTVLLLLSCTLLNAQEVVNGIPHPDRLIYHWPAQWIAHPTASNYDFGVYHFRKNFELTGLPDALPVNISADNRYRLFVNGRFVVAGPSRGDLLHWRYETVDIAPFLQKGKNTIAALVWNYGAERPWYQFSLQTGFVLQSDLAALQQINTDGQWLVAQNLAYSPITDAAARLGSYIVTGPRLQIDGAQYPWGWEQPDFDDSQWVTAKTIRNAKPLGNGTEFYWEMVPRSIPLTPEKKENPIQLRTAAETSPFLQNGLMIVPADTTISILLDQTYLTSAYPYLQVSQGAGSSIRLEYAESLIDDKGLKGNRNEIAGKKMLGYYDIFQPDGGRHRLFTTPWYRVWRYIEMTVTTKEKPLLIEQFYGMRTTYPFEEKASFSCDQEGIDQIWDVGWRTAELCAGETYMDCPYYEQLQYVGDTRIQALISLYVSGDDRLMRKAIQMFDDSRLSNGLTMSRYPSYSGQIIPPYSLFWITMVHDYWMHRQDEAFVRSMLPGVRSILEWHHQQLDQENGLLGTTPFWNFVDWTDEWPWNPSLRIGGVPETDGGSSILSLQLCYALKAAIELMEGLGDKFYADQYRLEYNKLQKRLQAECWDTRRQLFADTPDKKTFSQHANIMAILSDVSPEKEQRALLERIMKDPDLIPVTFYYRFYLMQALYKTGLGDRYLDALQPWYDMLALGLSTFAEKPDPTRSDCHAWSASPNYDLLATVAGIRPAAPGFQRVTIQPHPGKLGSFQAKMPHPQGEIKLDYEQKEGKAHVIVQLPEGVEGTLIFQQKVLPLRGGIAQQFDF